MNRRNTAIIASVGAAILALGAGTYLLTAGSPEPPTHPPDDALAVRPDVPDKPSPDPTARPVRGPNKGPEDKPFVRPRPKPHQKPPKPKPRPRPRRGNRRAPPKNVLQPGC